MAVIVAFACIAAASAALSIETRSPVAFAPLAALAVPAAVIHGADDRSRGAYSHWRLVLTPFAGNWQQLGIPGDPGARPAPDRRDDRAWSCCVLRRGAASGLPRPRPVHYVLALAMLWAVGSALVSHTLLQRAPVLKIVEAYGAFPFLIFYLAPVIYNTPRSRQMLLTALVVLGAYLGLTVVFELAGVNALVWPKYILKPNVRAPLRAGRGPFADAVANGLGLYVCALAPAWRVGLARPRQSRRRRGRWTLCCVGTLLTLERSVWTGVVVANAHRPGRFARLRRFAIPVVATVRSR